MLNVVSDRANGFDRL